MSSSKPPIPAIGPPHGPTPPFPENLVHGTSESVPGVLGEANLGPGVRGSCTPYGGGSPPGPIEPIVGGASDGVLGESWKGNGVHGISSVNGVWGESTGGGVGVYGTSKNGDGVFGTGAHNGVHGRSASAGDSGVWGENTGSGYGVGGSSTSGNGVIGLAGGAPATGVQRNGVVGRTTSGTDSGVWGDNTGAGSGVAGSSVSGAGIYGSSQSGWAGMFVGNVQVGGTLSCITGLRTVGAVVHTGDVQVSGSLSCGSDITTKGDIILANQDCAEDFEMSDPADIDPGTVVVIDSGGALKQSDRAYDRRVAGVVSGAGDCKPGIILGRQQLQGNKRPVALVGRVFCKVDAGYSPIEVGDLLTTSPTSGHAMKASDPGAAFGAVLGKALKPLASGLGIVPVLVALQ